MFFQKILLVCFPDLQFRKTVFSILFLAVTMLSTSCVVPPTDIGPSVLSDTEVNYLSRVTRGRAFVAKRKFDQAEVEFTYAISINPSIASAYNDLGFVLLEQNRLIDALSYFKKAAKLDENALAPRENIGRVYFKLGNYDSSQLSYRELLDINFRMQSLNPEKDSLSDDDLRSTYRNISLLLYMNGEEDESLCYSTLAASDLADPSQGGEHARLLLSLGKYKEALEFQGLLVEKYGLDRLPPSVVLDYAINAEFLGEHPLSRDIAWTLIRGRNGGRNALGMAIATFRISGAWQDDAHRDRLEEVQDLLDKDAGICDVDIITADYLPIRWEEKARDALKGVCNSDRPRKTKYEAWEPST